MRPTPPPSSRLPLLLLGLITLLAAAFLIFHATPLGERLKDWRSLARLIDDNSLQSQLTFVFISTLLITLGIPRLLFFTVGGFAFGFWTGLGWSVCSILIGSFLTFHVARACGREWLSTRFASHRHFGRIVNAKPTILTIAVLRLLPVSNAVINAVLAIGRVDNRTFLLGSLLGFLPYGVMAVMIGCGLAEESTTKGIIQIATAAAILCIAAWATARRFQRS